MTMLALWEVPPIFHCNSPEQATVLIVLPLSSTYFFQSVTTEERRVGVLAAVGAFVGWVINDSTSGEGTEVSGGANM